jgi:hypothetical protein
MVDTTARGFRYPVAGDHTRLWEHYQALADDVNDEFDEDLTLGGDLVVPGTLRVSDAAMQVQTDSGDVDFNAGASATFVDEGASDRADIVFVAPPSGMVLILAHFVLGLAISASAIRTVNGSFEVREGAVVGSGTVVLSPSDNISVQARAAVSGDTVGVGATTHQLLTGLTPGASYNVRTMVRVSATASVSATDYYRSLTVMPML